MSNTEITRTDKLLAATLLKLIPAWVTPNHMTVFRMLTVPFLLLFLVNGNYGIAIPLFIISAFSDALDGARARTENQITEWGKLYDPVADKILIGSVTAVVVSSFISPATAFIIIGLEVLIVTMALYHKAYAGIEIEAKRAGKIKMICQSVGIGLLLLYIVWPFAYLYLASLAFLYAAIFFAVLSIFVYKTI